MSGLIRILAVDDSLVVRSLLSRLIEAEPDLRLASTASDGRRGVEKVVSVKPDVVVLDVEMPVMSGVEALVEIRKIDPDLPVVMFSNLTRTGAATTLEALALGAKDYAPKPQGSGDAAESFDQIRRELFPKIRQVHQIREMKRQRRAEWSGACDAPKRARRVTDSSPATAGRSSSARTTSVDAVVLGASTGGPVALESVLQSITTPLPVPMIVVQHMPAVFTKALADRLDTKVASKVVEAEHGQPMEAGTCYIAPGGLHLSLERHPTSGVCAVTSEDPAINGCRPSVEPLFASAASVYGNRLAAVMLTGVGKDGSEGAATIAANGSSVIVQDEETSVVWGMPGVIADNGHASAVLPVDEIGAAISNLKFSGRVGVA